MREKASVIGYTREYTNLNVTARQAGRNHVNRVSYFLLRQLLLYSFCKPQEKLRHNLEKYYQCKSV